MKVFFIKCSVCGEMKFVNPEVLKKRIQKYGSIKKIESRWKCRNCVNKLKKINEQK